MVLAEGLFSGTNLMMKTSRFKYVNPFFYFAHLLSCTLQLTFYRSAYCLVHFCVKQHVSRGLLSMANAGPNTNGAQFFILFKDTPWLNGRHVVFGKMSEGDAVLDAIERVRTDSSDRPTQDITIADCGSIDVDQPYHSTL